jgi:CubicO group peptidase (beta-lactamase class C family)
VDQKLIEFFPEYIKGESDPRKKEISLKNLLTMSAGFRWNDRGPSMRNWYSSSDWLKFAIQLPLENNPGDVFNYNSSTSHLLSIILSKSTKTSTLDFAKRNLFEPLGIQSAYWHQDPQGYYIGGFGLGLSARDLAKIGFLYLNNGYWNGQSIVSEHWVKESTDQKNSGCQPSHIWCLWVRVSMVGEENRWLQQFPGLGKAGAIYSSRSGT